MEFDVVVIGGGHAGIEAAHASARLGCRTALLTLSGHTIGQMSCNPAIGGVAKGHLVREIDALGGVMGRLIDRAGIQFRMLNTGKGPAVRAPRAQADKGFYRGEARSLMESTRDLTILRGSAERLIIEGGRVHGLKVRRVLDEDVQAAESSQPQIALRLREAVDTILCRAVVVCTGTFLNGKIYRGVNSSPGGRDGEPGPGGLASSFREIGLVLGRHKTGTPARIKRSSINFGRLRVQPGDDPPPMFSYFGKTQPVLPQVSCHLTRTNRNTHDVIRRNIEKSPLYSGLIEGRGPRYCPSIEDKVVKFPEKQSHLVFLEPEGVDAPEIYPNGISTSLPSDVQEEFIRTLPGLEECELLRPGYAVEYDFVVPNQLDSRLGVRSCDGLFLAGQVNGTSGYEEAAAQGVVAGINAARYAQADPPFVLGRSEAYIGVLVDDLITKIPTDPYRMFTSNAEFRLILRQDNADRRLSEKAHEVGMLGHDEWALLQERWKSVKGDVDQLQRVPLSRVLRAREGNGDGDRIPAGVDPTRDKGMRMSALLKRPGVSYQDILTLGWTSELDPTAQTSVEAEIKYEGYIARMRTRLEATRQMDDVAIPEEFYSLLDGGLQGFSWEAREALLEIRPGTLGQASRLSGVRAAHVDQLCIQIKALNGSSVMRSRNAHPGPCSSC